jgi:putative addiction module killer protein
MLFSKSWKVEIYKISNDLEPFVEWKNQLGTRLRMKVLARLNSVQNGSFGEHRFLGDGVSELKLKDSIRIYYAELNHLIILVLCGGGKNTKNDQNKDIEKAKKYFNDYRSSK